MMYESQYGTTFDGKHSFADYGLYPADRPNIEDVEVQTNYVEIPGAHGYLDLTESLTGHPVYGHRDGTWKFISIMSRNKWDGQLYDIMQNLHGKRIERIVRDEEPDVYMVGRLSVDRVKAKGTQNTAAMQIEIEGYLEPWKYDMSDSMEDWPWDPFSFEYGVIREYSNISVSGTKVLNFVSSPMSGTPIFYTQDSGLTVTVGGVTFTLTAGTNIFPAIILPNDYSVVQMTFSGTGTVSVYYQGGRL